MKISRLLGICLAFASACSDGASSPQPDPVIGHYTLAAINGSPLPYQMKPAWRAISGELTILADGTYTAPMQIEKTINGVTAVGSGGLEGGTWVRRSDTSLSITGTGVNNAPMVIEGTSIRATDSGGFEYVYVRD